MAASKWHKITNITNASLAGSLDNKGGHVFKECNVTLNGDTAVKTEHFDFPVMGDLSILVNSQAVNINNDYVGSACKISMEGSIDNVNYVTLDTSAALQAVNTMDASPAMYLYDYDEEGRMPFMRLSLVGHTGATHETDEIIKIAVIPH